MSIGTIKGFCQLKSLDYVFIGYDKSSDPEGYAKIEKSILDAPFLRIIDIAVDRSSFLVLPPEGNALIDIRDMNSVRSWFECTDLGVVLLPPGLDAAKQFLEAGIRLSRKGGYNPVIRNMVIINSLRKGEFDDRFLFAK